MKNRRRLTGYLSLIAVVFSLWVFSGCSKSSDAGPTMTTIQLVASASFKESATVTDDKALDSLVKYLNAYPDLVALLGGTDKYTFFAPSNKAFKNLLALPGFPSNIKLINPALIQQVLYYHVVADQKLQSALTSGTSLTSVPAPGASAGEAIVVNTDGTLKTGSSNQSIRITVADQKTINGVFHITESVLIPPTVGASLTPILGTVAGTILLGADFTDLATIIAAADNGFTESAPNLQFKITKWLAMPISGGDAGTTANASGITFFSITNKGFAGIAAAMGGSTTEASVVASFASSQTVARNFLLNHLSVAKQYTVNGTNKFSANASITTLGKTISVTTGLTPGTTTGPYGIVFANSTPAQAYLAAEISPAAKNGQLHVIGGILK